MSDEKKRKKVIETVHSVKGTTRKIMEHAKNNMSVLQEDAKQIQKDAEKMAQHAHRIGD